jgi:hypothetical protein
LAAQRGRQKHEENPAIAMTRSASVARPGSEFDNFLFAPIGDERNGMLLSVLSALARLEVDPWLEAASLTRMPREKATARMASLIAALPDRPSAQPDTATVAARLIALLPRGRDASAPSRAAAPDGAATSTFWTILFVILMALMLGAQLFTASRQPAAPTDRAGAPALNAAPPRIHLPISGN